MIARYKIMVHHPRIIFPEAGEDGGRDGGRAEVKTVKAVVVRGLGVGSFVKELERRMDGALLPRSQWNGQLDGLECYITSFSSTPSSLPPFPPNDEDVSLLNPTSLSLHYNRSYSLLRSPVRHMHLSLDHVTTYLSYQDFQILARVLESWYRGNLNLPSVPPPSSSTSAHERGSKEAVAAVAVSPAAVAAAVVGGYYEVTFPNIKLGLMLRKADGLTVVDGLATEEKKEDVKQEGVERGSSGATRSLPRKGDVILSVNGQPAGDHAEVLRLMRALPRPITLGFSPRGEPFFLHLCMDDVVLHRSVMPDCLLLSDKVLGVGGGTEEGREVGRANAMLVSVEGRSVEGKGYHAALALLQCKTAGAGGGGREEGRRSVLVGLRLLGQPARVQEIEMEVGGVSLLAIDDSEGRDLPLIKAQAQALQARVMERVCPRMGGREGRREGGVRVLSAAVVGNVQVDYYNGRIGAWEPLVEPVGLSGSVRREGPAARSSSTSLPLSSSSLTKKTMATTTTLNILTTEALCLNVTDAALDLLLRTSQAWKETPARPSSLHPSLSSTTVAASNTHSAIMASTTTTFSGSSSSSSSSSSSNSSSRGATYLFQNHSGLPASFWAVRQETGEGGGERAGREGGRGINPHQKGQSPMFMAPAGAAVPFSVDQHRHVLMKEAEGGEGGKRKNIGGKSDVESMMPCILSLSVSEVPYTGSSSPPSRSPGSAPTPTLSSHPPCRPPSRPPAAVARSCGRSRRREDDES